MTSATDRLSGLTTSVAIKPPCKAVSTIAITQSGAQTIGGVACVDGDRYLYAITAGSVLNGIWVVKTGAHERAKDFDGNRDVVTGTLVLTMPATTTTGIWEVTTTGAIVIGTTSLSFALYIGDAVAIAASIGGGAITTTTGGSAVDLSLYAKKAGGNVFTGSQTVTPVALTDSATIATDAALGNHFTVTLGGNRTLGNPTNLTNGVILNWKVKQDGTGSRTLAYGSKFKWAGGTAPVLSTAAASKDYISAQYFSDDDSLVGSIIKGLA